MNQSSFIGLIHNTALLLTMALIFDLVVSRGGKSRSLTFWQIPLGILLGVIGIALMLTPWVLVPGIIFDTRSILLGISGLFFGSIPTIIAVIMTAAFRIFLGGTATWAGVAVIVASGAIGILWRQIRQKPLINYSGWELYLFGLVVHIVMLICMLILPLETALQILKNISLPVITIYPVGTVLLGLLMTNRLRRERITFDLQESEEKLRLYAKDLQKSEEQYRLLTENIKDVVWILDTETMYFTYVSPSVERLRGYTAEEIIREPVDHALTNEASENLKNLIRSRVVAFLNGEVSPDHFYADDVEQPCKDGSSVWTEAVTTYYVNPENGHVEVRGVTRDISRRKRIEFSLQEARDYLDSLIDYANGPIITLDPTIRITRFNHAFEYLSGYASDEVVGQELTILFPQANRKELLSRIAHTSAGEFLESVEIPILCKNGETRIVLWNSANVYAPDGTTLISIIAQGQDITQRKHAEEQAVAAQTELNKLLNVSDQSRIALLSLLEDQKQTEEKIQQLNLELEKRVLDRTAQLEAANQELEAFAYSVSHDLRAPLRALDGFSSALLMDYENQLDEQGRHFLMRIKEASQRMGQLIEDLLRLSRITRRDFNREQVGLSEMVHAICIELLENEPDRKVELEIMDGITVQADSHLIKIVLENLLSNAFKFTGKLDVTRIQFGVKTEDGEKVFFVSDNGVGFNMEYADKLFSPFQRLHAMTEFSGTGIGLATVQRIVTRHGGRIWPVAKENQGAMFCFTLGGAHE